MVSTRSRGKPTTDNADAGDKRPAEAPRKSNKKAKVEKDGKLDIGEDGNIGLKGEKKDEHAESARGYDTDNETGLDTTDNARDDQKQKKEDGAKEQVDGQEEGESHKPGEGPVVEEEARADSPGAAEGPSHGTLEAGHIYFLYRPKIDATDVESVDDVSKFHILLIPKTGTHGSAGYYHRVIEVGKKKLPDPGAKRQVIWGLVGSVSTDKAGLKDAFGEYSYETKTKGKFLLINARPKHGTRTQQAARPAARGHYILHSPRDEAADSPDHDKQRDYKTLLAYEITTPAEDDFGRVQEELGLEVKGAVMLSVKDPEAPSQNNPRAANMPREKKAHYPKHLSDLFDNRRWIPPNPISFLDYPGTELLFMSSPHELKDSLGKDGEHIEEDMDHAAHAEATDVQGALKELGMSKGDTEIEALEGAWA